MGFEVGKKFWIAATAVIVVVTLFVVGRNLLHAVKIKRQINALNREREFYPPVRKIRVGGRWRRPVSNA